MALRLFASFLVATITGCATAPAPMAQKAAEPNRESPLEWAAIRLPGKQQTSYRRLELDGRQVVHARSDSAASLLRRKVWLEPQELRSIRFSWRVQELIAQADLTDMDQSDSPVRVIMAFDGDHSRLSMRDRLAFELAQAVTGETPPFATLMYVWDNRVPPETVIRSGRTDRVRKIVVESGARRLGRWNDYERDIDADFRKSFGEPPGRLLFIGLMTDSDNTRSVAEGWYGEIRLLTAPDVLH